MAIETEDLVVLLGNAEPAPPPFSIRVLAIATLFATGALTILILGLRKELLAGHFPNSFWIKTLLLGAFALLSVSTLEAAAAPLGRSKLSFAWGLFAAVFGGLIAREWTTHSAQEISGLFTAPNFPFCVFFVLLYGCLAMAGFALALRSYAPQNARECAGLTGLATGAIACVGYSIHCPFDSPTFIAIAYGVPLVILFLTGRAFLERFLKW